LKDVPKDTKIIVYCRSGSRSAIAIEIFKTMGFSDLINGINQFRAKELSMQ
jgi:rhodanese-related sulfurtransferase